MFQNTFQLVLMLYITVKLLVVSTEYITVKLLVVSTDLSICTAVLT